MPKWLLIVGLALVAILSFLLIQGPLAVGPTGPSDPGRDESEQAQGTESGTDSGTSAEAETSEPGEQARRVMRQAREAQGGLSALQDLSGYRVEANSMTQQRGQTFSLETETWIRLPNQLRQSTVISLQGQTINSLTVWDGEQGWVRQQGQVQQLQGNQAGSVQQSLYLDPLHITMFTARDDFTYAYGGTETLNGTEAHAIDVTTPQGESVTYFFDADNYLPVQRMRSAQGNTVRTVYRDYQRVDGYAFAFTQRTYLNDSLASEQIVESVEVNPSFDPQLFQEPQTEGQQSGQ